MLIYPRSADTCLTQTVINWLSAPVIMDNVTQHHIFSVTTAMYFMSKSHETARHKSVKWITLASSPREKTARRVIKSDTVFNRRSVNILNLQYLKMSTTRKILTLHDRVAVLKRLDSGTLCRVIAAELHCGKNTNRTDSTRQDGHHGGVEFRRSA